MSLGGRGDGFGETRRGVQQQTVYRGAMSKTIASNRPDKLIVGVSGWVISPLSFNNRALRQERASTCGYFPFAGPIVAVIVMVIEAWRGFPQQCLVVRGIDWFAGPVGIDSPSRTR